MDDLARQVFGIATRIFHGRAVEQADAETLREAAEALQSLAAENARLTALVHQLGENAATAAREYAEGVEGLRAERDALANAIADPNTVHVNLLRGSIARPTVHQMIHIYSPAKVRDALDVYARQALAKGAAAHD